MSLESATWPEIEAAGRSKLLSIPVGSLEQHGPHLPLNTDTRIATELAVRLCALRPDVMMAPPLPYGASGEHAGFPGTLLLNHEVLAGILVELVRSARAAFAGVIVISAHGGNGQGLALLEQTCRAEGDGVLTWEANAPGADAHAGRTETSLMLAIDATVVRLERAEAGCTEPLATLMPRLRAEGVRPISSNGVLGDPDGANAAEGELLLRSMTDDLAAAVAGRWPVVAERGT
jgi:mycofactocin system creatininase family protein